MSRCPRTRRPWREIPHDAASAATLASELGVAAEIAVLLWQRGLRDAERARAFLRPSLKDLHPPESIADLEAAAARILAAAAAGARIAVYGDYDVDGVCGTAILVEALAELGIAARSYIPHRIDEGYGLNEEALRKLRAEGIDLLVTVDGGANDREELAVAREIGLEVIVTDHHPIDGDLPHGLLVHPGRPDSPSPSRSLCGAGVAYKLAWGLGRRAAGGERVSPRFRAFLEEALGLAALGTVADVVPLTGENRAIVAHGLRSIARSARPGLRALLDACAVSPAEIAASDIGFRLAPHINAAGRLGEVDLALELLHTRDERRGRELAASLATLNRRRKAIEQAMVDDCLAEIAESGAAGDAAGDGPLLFAREGWHSGVAGIVAARLVERLERPVFVVALAGGIGRGSARSLPERPLTELYGALREHVRSVGGHALAGGVTVDRDRVEALRAALAGSSATGMGPLSPREFDLAVPAEAVGLELARGIAALAPFGAGNPEPILRVDGLSLAEPPRLVGAREEHLLLRFRRAGGSIDAIWFRGAPHAGSLARAKGPISLLAALEVDHYRGIPRPRLRIIDQDDTALAPAAEDLARRSATAG